MSGRPIEPDEMEAWRGAIGRTLSERQVLDIEPLRRLAAAIGLEPDGVAAAPPPLAHWAYFLEVVAAERLGQDGHARRGGFMPAVRLPRRMFAAGRFRFEAPLEFGAEAECVTRIADVRHRTGSSGEMVLVEVERVIAQNRADKVIEQRTIIYRDHGAIPAVAADADADTADAWTPGPVDLFRFSAATFNGHRIHYDAPYVTEEEGYPGLVVHGPFTAMKLAAAAAARAGGPLARFAFRATAPLFVSQPVRIRCAGEAGGELNLSAIRCDGQVAMTATAALQDLHN